MAYQDHRDLMAWQKSMLLTKRIYKTTRLFPTEERFALANQIQRSATFDKGAYEAERRQNLTSASHATL